jgi:hypothetical protein
MAGMYTSPDEARSDLFLAGAVFLLGPIIVDLLLSIIPLRRLPGAGTVLDIALPLVFTVLVPYLLIRYRNESLRSYGLGPSPGALGLGVLLGAPVVVAAVVATVVEGDALGDALPVLFLADGAVVLTLARLASWLGLAGLAVYGTVKARDAFRGDPQTLRTTAVEIGRVVAGVSVVATVLLALALDISLGLLLLPLGVAGAVVLAVRSLRGPSSTTRPTLLTPVVLLALGPFALSFDAFRFVTGLWLAALLAGIGLAMGMLMTARRSAYGVVAFAVVLALFTPLSAIGR